MAVKYSLFTRMSIKDKCIVLWWFLILYEAEKLVYNFYVVSAVSIHEMKIWQTTTKKQESWILVTCTSSYQHGDAENLVDNALSKEVKPLYAPLEIFSHYNHNKWCFLSYIIYSKFQKNNILMFLIWFSQKIFSLACNVQRDWHHRITFAIL